MFIIKLLGSVKISAKHPVMVRVDNIGAKFMASNFTTTCHIKHMDIGYKYVNEYVKNGVVKIVFVKSTDNDSNSLNKNLSAKHYKKHSKKMVAENPYNVARLKCCNIKYFV